MRELKKEGLETIKGLAVVEVYKPECKSCKELQPVLENLSKDYQGKLDFYSSHFVKGGLGQHFGLNINYVPTIILLKDGELVQKFTGAKYLEIGKERTAIDSESLRKKLDKFLEKYFMPMQISQVRDNNLETKLELSENSLTTLKERYLKKDENGNVIEKPEDMFMRVAKNIASADSNYGKSKDEIKRTVQEFYNSITDLKFLPNSPTLMNAGRDLQQLSACFVLPIEDSIESIFGAAREGALIHKSGGGTGYSFSKLRPKNWKVRSTSGVASGPVSFIDVFNVYTETVKQGGTRRGANMGILRVDHPDIREFIHAKGELNEMNKKIVEIIKEKLGLENDNLYIQELKKTLLEKTQLNNFNISVAITEEFMNKLKKDDYFELKDPHSGKITEKIKAKKLLDEIVDQAWKTGDPGIVFLDIINESNPTPNLGEIEATNPCGEQPLLPHESCNLGSINLTKFLKDGAIDYNALRDTIHTAVHFLDNVIDMNRYPLPQIEEMTKSNRKIGLGVMGFADMITMLRIPYGSEESYKIAEKIMNFIDEEAKKASIGLAKERGVFPNWEGSIYDSKSPYFKGEELRLRNATLTTIAPTGTLAQIADCEWGIEPAFSLAYTKTVMDGKVLHYKARGLEKVLKEENYNTEEIFGELEKGKRNILEQLPEKLKKLTLTSMLLTPEQHIKIQATFQKYVDNAVSKTINFSANTTKEDIKKAFLLSHELRCKGITVYRDRSKDIQVLEEKREEEYNFGSKRPKELLGIVRRERIGNGKNIFVTTGYFENKRNQKEIERLKKEGRPTEFFVAANFFDPRTHGLITALAIRSSKDLRKGIPVEEIVEDLKNLPPSDETGYDEGFGEGREYLNRSVTDAIGKAVSGWEPPISKDQKDEVKDVKEETKKENPNGFGFCIKCHRYGIMSREGCDKCIYCDYSEKGCS